MKKIFWIILCFVIIIFSTCIATVANADCQWNCGPTPTPHICLWNCGPTTKPTATPSPTKTPCYEDDYGWESCVTPTTAPTTSPTPICNVDHPQNCPTPTVTPTTAVSPTPTSTPNTGGNGGGSTENGGNNPPPVAQCVNDAFVGPVLVSFTDKGNGTVNFAWTEITGGINKYSIIYGYSPDSLVYGQDNIPGNVHDWDIHDLKVGSHVWAKVSAWLNNCSVESNLFDPIVR